MGAPGRKDNHDGTTMIGRLNHVAIAVRDIAKASDVYRKTLGASVSAPPPTSIPSLGEGAGVTRRELGRRAPRLRSFESN